MIRGLTTAAIIWLTAAVGMACGAGLPLLAIFVTATHFLVIYCYGRIARRILSERADLQVRYLPGKGAVEKVMQRCTGRGYVIENLAVEQSDASGATDIRAIHFQVSGRRGVAGLLVAIGDIKGVISATSAATNA
jgi:putative Mg2+ transporter-C (MgtC) family protein